MLKYRSGEEPAIGDVFKHDGQTVTWTIIRRDAEGDCWRAAASDAMMYGSNARANIEDADLVRRASPPEPVKGEERFDVGAVWTEPEETSGTIVVIERPFEDRMRIGWHIHNAFTPSNIGAARKTSMAFDASWRTYAGNLSAVFDALGKLHAPSAKELLDRYTIGKLAPVVDAEAIAAKQREKHRAEAAALQERYAAFRSTVERVVREEAPAARVVTDVGQCPAFGGSVLIGWLSIGDLRAEVNVSEREDLELAEHRTRAALNDFRHRLGSRALRKAGR